MVFRLSFLFILILFSGCAHVSSVKDQKMIFDQDPQAVFLTACEQGSRVLSAKGSVWLKASSKDASGQFPADVAVESPQSLQMEAHNLLGGTEAVIQVKEGVFSVETPDHVKKIQKSNGFWGGLPLEWAPALFLGRIPCPSADLRTDAQVSFDGEGQLRVETRRTLGGDPQKFIYQFKLFDEKPWVEGLHWEKEGIAPLSVDFKFSQPEALTRSPLRWEAKSSLGEIKMTWKQREYELVR